jgi:hypothetical protein
MPSSRSKRRIVRPRRPFLGVGMSFWDLVAVIIAVVAMVVVVVVMVASGVMLQSFERSLVLGRKTCFCFKLLDTSSVHGS